ncbi:hypothetical protein H4R18_000353 [Coemansia javaensis]|uniref:C2H2-type domain-containing protein n=1 Tax=Coemansia javaensis TaxID=2761396 RepID=A0A9W8LMB9_9FUNG|nr:hypothetical protein H4R18_000353 [Coemansia javaensis]
MPCAPFVGDAATAPLLGPDDALFSAYQGFLDTPSAVLPAGAPLFAPLDEIRSHEAAQTDDLLIQLAAADPEFRQSLVHALVNHINPVVAYEPVVGTAGLASPCPALSPADLGLASPGVAEPQFQWPSSIEADAPFVESLMALFAPIGPSTSTPPTPATGSASPAALELVSPPFAPADLFRTPMLQTIAEREDEDEDDVPLSAMVVDAPPAPRRPAAGQKRPREDDDDDGGDGGEPARAGDKRFYCDICNRGFARQFNMRTHRLTHDPKSVAARPHQCNRCSRSFTRKHDLERHQVLHDDSDAFKCGTCGRGFARLDVLERHANALHRGKA